MKRILFIFITIVMMLLSACSLLSGSRDPVTLTLWHNYGGQMKNTMDAMIDEFNATIGAKEGIIISVTSISGSQTLHDKLTMAAAGDPGAPDMPDITTAYPKTALILAKKGLLVNMSEKFTADELSAYIPQFVDEGRILDGQLYVFPTAKSTEVLFVNTTIFNRFAMATGITLDELATFEGLARAAEAYYQWTDDITPDIENDGKMFYMSDSLFNFAMIGTNQLGVDMFDQDKLSLESPAYRRIWDLYFKAGISGRFAAFDGYATDLAKTGDIVCSTGSTAGVLFFSPTVTYEDNTSEPVELAILPYPVFESGRKVAIQRGGGMCVIKSDKRREDAAVTFLKWFTRPENNLRFVSSTGYLPVTNEAFGELMNTEIKNIENDRVKKLLKTCKTMHDEYDFYIPPLFDSLDELQEKYENLFIKAINDYRDEYITLLESTDAETALKTVSEAAYKDFVSQLPNN
ncbi:MAG TPA: extracellular solute-binding protein [Candidatus Atribacteria bacterium]|nr:extracellular solute-binding protein [Candidatus Atribacteria bacterium]HPT78765.1 extracellular solute-binding protein [Candidatus Atribacteria bacterium]